MCICNPDGQIEYSSLFVLPSATLSVILGMPLLTQHNPDINLHARTVTNNLSFCSEVPLRSTTVESPLTLTLHYIPPENRGLQMVFSKTRISLPGIVPLTCCLVPSLHVEKFTRSPWPRWRYMVEALKGFHPPLQLTGFFQLSGLCPCIVYRGLNAVTVKNKSTANRPICIIAAARCKLLHHDISTECAQPGMHPRGR